MLQLVVTFDITGSMASVLGLVNKNVKSFFTKLPPDTQIAFIGHGNHSDRNKGLYMSGQFKDLNDPTLLDFLANRELVSGYYGGSSRGFKGNSCSAVYELALNKAKDLKWDVNASKAVVVIGDEEPSDLSYGIDWRKEANDLVDLGVRLYGVQCLGNRNQYFYDALAQASDGVRVNLDQFSDVIELLLAICYKEQGGDSLESFAESLKNQNRMSRSLLSAFNLLSSGTIGEKLKLEFVDYSKLSDKDLVPVEPSRFQIMDVDRNQDIKSFVLETGARFKTGAGFYELEKSETIQERKQIVLQEKLSGDMWSGEAARNMIGLPMGVRGTISPRSLPSDLRDKYRVFVQSTSNNRKLMGGSKFLYEVDKSA